MRLAYLFVALALGLGWAVRGHFGHEWGASWAGALAAAAVLLMARRQDWAQRLPVLVALAAVGWGVGGMMSYGLLVGYGRGTDFVNVFYGLAMLGVVGGLYGFIGGGLFGLGLDTCWDHRPDWARLVAEMVAGAWLAWGLLIYQLEWFMTPPRSELWAACLGAAVALAWYLQRYRFHRALRTAGYAALGAGFGFAFGNFLQTLGRVSGIPINWWNVMEFSLGFFGGLGMAYAVFTRTWPDNPPPSRTANHLALGLLLVGIPVTNMIQTYEWVDFVERALELGFGDPDAFATAQWWIALAVLCVFGGLGWRNWQGIRYASREVPVGFVALFFYTYAAYYIIAAHIRKGVFGGGASGQPEQLAYWGVLGLLVLVQAAALRAGDEEAEEEEPAPAPPPERRESLRRWAVMLAYFLLVLLLLTVISLLANDGIGGAQRRF